uniref:Uncharacterized protein n=1 Tax=Cyprinus carpio carpio TaxID=630221 RepID=A0A9J7XE93_CYPCA
MDCGKVENCSVVRRIKKEAISKHDPEAQAFSLGQGSFKMDCGNVENCYVVKDNPSCYQRSVQKPASLMVWGCMSACGMGSLHIWKATINAERYIQVLEQHMLPSRHRLFQGRPCIFQHDNIRPQTASITTSWLRRRRIQVLKWPACSPDL